MKKFVVNKDNAIEYGLGGIKGVADSFITHVSKVRNSHEFKDLWDFTRNIDIKLGGKKSLEALSFAGAFDSIAPSRSIAIACIGDMLQDGGKAITASANSGDLFATIDTNFNPYEKYTNIINQNLVDKKYNELNPIGTIVDTEIKAIKDNIIFCSLEEDIDGAIFSQNISWDSHEDSKDQMQKFNVGDKIKAMQWMGL